MAVQLIDISPKTVKLTFKELDLPVVLSITERGLNDYTGQ
jgi:hypothetical protein